MFTWDTEWAINELEQSYDYTSKLVKIDEYKIKMYNYLPFELRMVLYLYKLVAPMSLPRDALCQVRLTLANWFWRRKFLKCYIFSVCCYYLPKENAFTWTNLILPYQKCFVISLIDIGSLVLEEMKTGKVYRQTDRQMMDNQQSEDHLSSGELKRFPE